MSRFVLAAALLATAAPAFAQQQPAASGPPNPIQQASMAFSQCIRAGISGVAGTVSPEAGAGTVLNRCAPQRQALEASVETMIATMPEAEKAAAREQMRTQLGQIRTQVAAAIRQSRSTSR